MGFLVAARAESVTSNRLSAVLITRNAALQLPTCLASLAFCDEVLVVDSGSDDDTVALARQQGARVIETHWRGFGPQKQFAEIGRASWWGTVWY